MKFHRFFLNKKILIPVIGSLIISSILAGCSEEAETPRSSSTASTLPSEEAEPVKGTRDNTPVCLVPEASGTVIYENEFAVLDASNSAEGYVMVRYIGSSPKVKLQITGPNETTYTYNLSTSEPKDEVFPLQSGDGEYIIKLNSFWIIWR